jgi:uncharacterized protein
MINEITPQNIAAVTNPRLAEYAKIYLKIEEQFAASVHEVGLEFEAKDDRAEIAAQIEKLGQKGAHARNDTKSVYLNRLSPGCEACQLGLGSATFFISLKCHRSCFFCFNPNQEGYEHFQTEKRDCLAELDQIAQSGQRLEHIALTGGEPLLHREETIEFFRRANEKFPNVYKRLYTTGDQLDAEMGEAFQRAHVDEIRFSIRVHDSPNARQHTLKQIALAQLYVPNIMVEMPVLPDALEPMKQILTDLNDLQIFGINLLEFCFPLNNAEEYRRRGYRIKQRPYRVLYNYGYAGGLPIAGSEAACLHLMDWAIDQKFGLGIHYCSLENKHTGEIYQRHFNRPLAPHLYFSPRDYFLKSAKVFGKDLHRVLPIFEKNGYRDFQRNRDHYYAEFHPSQIEALRSEDLQVGIATHVLETRGDGEYLRELKVDWTTPQAFDFAADV